VAAYKSAEDLYKYMGQIFELAFQTDGLKEKLSATGVTLTLNLADPESTIAVDFAHGPVAVRNGVHFGWSTMVATDWWFARDQAWKIPRSRRRHRPRPTCQRRALNGRHAAGIRASCALRQTARSNS